MTGTYIIFTWADCPDCGIPVRRHKVFFAGRELYAGKLCLCHGCDMARIAQETASLGFLGRVWVSEVPEDYRNATEAQIWPSLKPLLSWVPERQKGLGIFGGSGKGKTNAMALLTKRLQIPFRWFTGIALKGISNDMMTLDGKDRDHARSEWQAARKIPLLVIDDIAETRPTAPWAEKLMDLLEERTSARRLTFWTAQHGPGQLSARLQENREVDARTADAIERRLVQHYAIFQA